MKRSPSKTIGIQVGRSPQTAKSKVARPPRVVRTRPLLRIEHEGARQYVKVPVALAADLHRYLRSHRIWSSPPRPYLSDFDCIEIDRKMDAERVQGLLKSWS